MRCQRIIDMENFGPEFTGEQVEKYLCSSATLIKNLINKQRFSHFGSQFASRSTCCSFSVIFHATVLTLTGGQLLFCRHTGQHIRRRISEFSVLKPLTKDWEWPWLGWGRNIVAGSCLSLPQLCRTLAEACCLESGILCDRHRRLAERKLTAVVLIVGCHCEGKSHVLCKELLHT